MASNEIREKLNAGIAAAQQGNRATARRLLEQVVTADAGNEVAWMWLASCAETLADRRRYLQRALALNPGNERAREALDRLDKLEGRAPRRGQAQGGTATPPPGAARNSSWLLILAAVLGVLGVAALLFFTQLSSQTGPPPGVTPTLVADLTDNAATLAVGGGARATQPPTATLVPLTPRSLDNLERDLSPLPPTPTHTLTPTGTATYTPSPTPFPLATFALYYTAIAPGDSQPMLYRANGDGSSPTPLLRGVREFSIDITGTLIAFTRDVSYAPDGSILAVQLEATEAPEGTAAPEFLTVPELFVAPLDNPDAAQQITTLRSLGTSSPSWAPDGVQLVFSSDFDGDPELWIITEDGNNLRQLTFNDASDTQPVWSPRVGDNRIIFTSDLNSPLLPELYVIGADAAETDVPQQLTDDDRSSYAPVWSPDGSSVGFISDRSGDGDVYLMNPDGSDQRLLTQDDNGAEDRSLAFTPDARMVVFISNRSGAAFLPYTVDLRGRTVQPLSATPPEGQSFLTLMFQPDVTFLLR